MLSVLASLFVSSSLAQADVIATAQIDWSSLNMTLIDLDPNNPVSAAWVPGSEYGSVYADATTADPFDPASDMGAAFDFTTPLSTSAVTSLAQAYATRDSSLLGASASSQVGASAAAPNSNYASGQAHNSGTFTVTGHGIVMLTVDWALSVTGAIGDSDDWSYASAALSAEYQNGSTETEVWSTSWLQSTDNCDRATSGTFTLTIANLPGMTTTGSLSADVYASAQSQNLVPEPSTFALTGLGVGLMGLMAYRRRRP